MTTHEASKRTDYVAGGGGLVLLALAILVHPAFFLAALVAFSLPLLKMPGQRSWGWTGLVFAVIAATILFGYTVGKDLAMRDNAASEHIQAQ